MEIACAIAADKSCVLNCYSKSGSKAREEIVGFY